MYETDYLFRKYFNEQYYLQRACLRNISTLLLFLFHRNVRYTKTVSDSYQVRVGTFFSLTTFQSQL